MSIQNNIPNNIPTKIIQIPVSDQDLENIQKQAKQQRIQALRTRKSEDRFASRTMTAANVGTGVGAGLGALSIYGIKKLFDTHKIESIGLGNIKLLSAKSSKPVKIAWAAVSLISTIVGIRWQTAGIYNIASSMRKSLNNKSTGFDQQQIKETNRDVLTGVVEGAALNIGVNALTGQKLTSGIGSSMFDLATMSAGIRAIDKAKAIKHERKEEKLSQDN